MNLIGKNKKKIADLDKQIGNLRTDLRNVKTSTAAMVQHNKVDIIESGYIQSKTDSVLENHKEAIETNQKQSNIALFFSLAAALFIVGFILAETGVFKFKIVKDI